MITEKNNCTGCNACMAICSEGVITNYKDGYDTVYPRIDNDGCVHCGKCSLVCPNNIKFVYKFPEKVYAAWSNDDYVKNRGASGGVASEIYLYGLKNGYYMMGTFFEREKGVYFKVIQNEKDVEWACDSKYVFSDMTMCFGEYEKKLNDGIKCIFIGLPCQVAAIKSYCTLKCKENIHNLVTIDIICHGVPNFEYLDQHLTKIEHKKKVKVKSIRFRMISEFIMHLYDKEGQLIYKKGMHVDDLYYRAFAVNLDFRENCYHCKYARSERISDVTLGDYDGLGKLWPYHGIRSHESVVLCMTQLGENLIDRINIHKMERPLAEPASGNTQLRHPSIPFKTRDVFLNEYQVSRNFEKASYRALRYLICIYYCNLPKKWAKKIIPKKLKLFYKRWKEDVVKPF